MTFEVKQMVDTCKVKYHKVLVEAAKAAAIQLLRFRLTQTSVSSVAVKLFLKRLKSHTVKYIIRTDGYRFNIFPGTRIFSIHS